MKSYLRVKVTDYLLLAIALVAPTALCLIGKLEIYPSLINLARHVDSYSDLCRMLEYSNRCAQAFIYTWLLSRLPPCFGIAIQVMPAIAMYTITRKLFDSALVKAFAILTYITTPSILLLGSLDQSGLALSSSLIALSAILLTHYFLFGGAKGYLAAGIALYTFMIFHPAVVLVLLPLVTLLMADYVRNRIASWKAGPLAIMVALMVLLLILTKPVYYDIYTIPLLLISTGLLALAYITHKSSQPAHKIVALALITMLGFVSGITVYVSKAYNVAQYFVELNPVVVFGLPGLLTIPAFLYVMETASSGIEKYLVALALITGSLAFLSPYAIPIAVTLITVSGSIFINRVLKSDILSNRYKTLMALTVIGLVAVSALGSYTASATATERSKAFLEISELSRKLNLGLKLDIDLRALGDAIAQAIESTASNKKILLISHWDYSYWLQNALIDRGIRAIVLTHPYGDLWSKGLFSRIMVSEWSVSRKIIENISHDLGVNEVYLLVAGAYSVRNIVYSYVGIPRELRVATGQYPVLVYDAYGDLANIPVYLRLGGKTEEEYLLFGAINIGERAGPLLWTSRGEQMFIVQLHVMALREFGYFAVYNAMISAEPLNTTIVGFSYVYSRNIRVGELSTRYGNYEVYYVFALFKLQR